MQVLLEATVGGSVSKVTRCRHKPADGHHYDVQQNATFDIWLFLLPDQNPVHITNQHKFYQFLLTIQFYYIYQIYLLQLKVVWWQRGVIVNVWPRSTRCSTSDPVTTWMDDCLLTGKPTILVCTQPSPSWIAHETFSSSKRASKLLNFSSFTFSWQQRLRLFAFYGALEMCF